MFKICLYSLHRVSRMTRHIFIFNTFCVVAERRMGERRAHPLFLLRMNDHFLCQLLLFIITATAIGNRQFSIFFSINVYINPFTPAQIVTECAACITMDLDCRVHTRQNQPTNWCPSCDCCQGISRRRPASRGSKGYVRKMFSILWSETGLTHLPVESDFESDLLIDIVNARANIVT